MARGWWIPSLPRPPIRKQLLITIALTLSSDATVIKDRTRDGIVILITNAKWFIISDIHPQNY